MVSESEIIAMGKGELSTPSAFKSLQAMINSGDVWQLDQSYHAIVMDLIGAGRNMLGKEHCFDRYGNFVPSRDYCLPGRKGSFKLVVDSFGEDYAKGLEEDA